MKINAFHFVQILNCVSPELYITGTMISKCNPRFKTNQMYILNVISVLYGCGPVCTKSIQPRNARFS